MLDRPYEVETDAGRAFVDARRATLLSAAHARELGGAYELFVPFLERGGTVAVVPVASAGELIAALTVVSLDPGAAARRRRRSTPPSCLAAHAALAIDNARLYQQQQHFLESMQQALLPQIAARGRGPRARARPTSRRPASRSAATSTTSSPSTSGRLAVVLGDVTGHGVDAAADMAMAKYVFRSLVREHPQPGDLLAAANGVVGSEIALGKFITMAVLLVDGATGAAAVRGRRPSAAATRPRGPRRGARRRRRRARDLARRALRGGVGDPRRPATRSCSTRTA